MEETQQSVAKPAGFWIRLGASILDTLIVMVPLSMVSYMMTGQMEGDLVTSLLSVLYYIIVPVLWVGYTIGKRIVGIRIAKVNGEKIGFGTTIMRYVVAGIVYTITFGLAVIASGLMVLFRKDKRSIHDLMAGTQVIHDKAK